MSFPREESLKAFAHASVDSPKLGLSKPLFPRKYLYVGTTNTKRKKRQAIVYGAPIFQHFYRAICLQHINLTPQISIL
jgi:hypothetical protein